MISIDALKSRIQFDGTKATATGKTLVGRLLTKEEMEQVCGADGGYGSCGMDEGYTQNGGTFTQSGGSYTQGTGTYTMKC